MQVMLSVEDALQMIVDTVRPSNACEVELSAALGHVLAADVLSTIDSPPFDKSMMDGYAVRTADLNGGATTLHVVAEVTAGMTPQRGVGRNEAIRIMTGAPIPEGADAVVRIEETEFDESAGTVRIESSGVDSGTNIIRRGASMRAGERVLPAGRKLRAQELGALAESGEHRVSVLPIPEISVLATGDELVPIDQQPGPGQIRNSNETMLLAQARAAGCRAKSLGIARDRREELEERIREGLKSDILCLSGGVSAGKFDLVPSALAACGVKQVFHKVQVKPGKPVWFGVLEPEKSADGRPRCIFGLPGNPVSSMVCFELFVRAAVNRLQGIEPATPRTTASKIGTRFHHSGDRPTYFPARLEWTVDGAVATPLDWKGSSDLRSTVDAQALIAFPAGDREYRQGDRIEVVPLGAACGL
ncbi:MAG: molybdopterin molybdenumtransferase MoeA [Planctomycetota bacterium]|nr:MAG: molybdopterin molybdenumtransferase MoeA [Planctomycetota bacterium]